MTTLHDDLDQLRADRALHVYATLDDVLCFLANTASGFFVLQTLKRVLCNRVEFCIEVAEIHRLLADALAHISLPSIVLSRSAK